MNCCSYVLSASPCHSDKDVKILLLVVGELVLVMRSEGRLSAKSLHLNIS